MTLLKKITGTLHALATLFFLLTLTLLIFIPFFCISLLKLFPNSAWRSFCTRQLHHVAELWIRANNFYFELTKPTQLTANTSGAIQPARWNLIVANHQSWLDIVILQYVLNRILPLPLLKFFIKDELKWIPLLGFAWWALDFPFMKRYSKEYLAKNPHKAGNDLKTTLKAIEQFKKTPSSIVNFVEGTRFTSIKKQKQQSSYTHLLNPKAGGVSMVVGAMSQEINQIIDISIAYSVPKHSIWDFLCHRIPAIQVEIRTIPIPDEFRQPSLLQDSHLKALFRDWLNAQWDNKDQIINKLKSNFSTQQTR